MKWNKRIQIPNEIFSEIIALCPNNSGVENALIRKLNMR